MCSPLLLLPALLSPCAALQEPAGAGLPRVLFLTHSAGFVHSVVRRPAADELVSAFHLKCGK